LARVPEPDEIEVDVSSGRRADPLLVVAARAADAKQASDIVVLEVGDIIAIADWFLICSASNVRQVRTIAEEIELAVKREAGNGPLRTEGLDDLRWVLLDYGDLVVHVFLDETRRFYDLERLWRDAPRLDWAS
jgi:ribosome-associated protein